jgi:hypothetical protein
MALSAPQPREGIEDAARRFESAVRSGDCERVRTLSFSGEQPDDARCGRFLERLKDFDAIAAARYGTGGVVDFTTERSPGTMVFVLGRDRSFRWATLLGAARGKGVVGKAAPRKSRLDAVASSAVKALRSGDCAQFAKAAKGILPEPRASQTACEKRAGLRAKLERDPDAAARRLGANSRVAFYSLLPEPDGPYFTLVLLVKGNRAALLRDFAVPPRRERRSRGD